MSASGVSVERLIEVKWLDPFVVMCIHHKSVARDGDGQEKQEHVKRQNPNIRK